MLTYSEIKRGKIIVFNGEPYRVLESHVAKRTKQKPVNQTKLKSLLSGNVQNVPFHQKDMVEEAYLEKKVYTYEYRKRDEVWFKNPDNPSDTIQIDLADVEQELNFITTGNDVTVLIFEEKIIGLEIPVKVRLKVAEAPPSIKGNTASGGTKKVVLETGFVTDAPLFIEEGDMVEINTDTGEYSTRV